MQSNAAALGGIFKDGPTRVDANPSKSAKKQRPSILRGVKRPDDKTEFRSVVLQLEVILVEKLKRIDPTRATAFADRKDIYVALFNDIIDHDRTYGRLLARIKDMYEEFVSNAVDKDAQRMQDRLVDENRKLHERLDHYAKAYQELFEGRTEMTLTNKLLHSTITEKEASIKKLQHRLRRSGLRVDLADDPAAEREATEGDKDELAEMSKQELIEHARSMENYMLQLQSDLEMAKSSETAALYALDEAQGYLGESYDEQGLPKPYEGEEEEEENEDDELVSGEWTDPPLVNHRKPPSFITPLKFHAVPLEPDEEGEEGDYEEDGGEGGNVEEGEGEETYDSQRSAVQQDHYSEHGGDPGGEEFEQDIIEQQEALITYCTEALERGEELPPELQQMLSEFGIDIERQQPLQM
jgi:hypothetical protein